MSVCWETVGGLFWLVDWFRSRRLDGILLRLDSTLLFTYRATSVAHALWGPTDRQTDRPDRIVSVSYSLILPADHIESFSLVALLLVCRRCVIERKKGKKKGVDRKRRRRRRRRIDRRMTRPSASAAIWSARPSQKTHNTPSDLTPLPLCINVLIIVNGATQPRRKGEKEKE